VSVLWAYERTGEGWLLDLARKARDQGFDWRGHFEDFRYTRKLDASECIMDTHVVNNAMGIKAPGVWYRVSRDPEDRAAVSRNIETLDRYHGQVTGVFSGDEHYAGKSPSQGTELCAVAEYLYSLEVLLSALGDPALGDRLERIAYNALPATFSPDMWAHQYDQQVNQVVCKVAEDRVYTNNGPASNIFGLEPNFGCCTANIHQGWPKFAAHLWMRSPDGGLAAVAYGPCEVNATAKGAPVRIQVETEYPFDERIRIAVDPEHAVTFPLHLRIPGWAAGATVRASNGDRFAVEPGTFVNVTREWRPGDTVEIRFPMAPRLERRFNNSVALHRGPLVFSLKIREEWRQVGGELPHGDWEVYPLEDWNYGLRIDEGRPGASVSVEFRGVGSAPFWPEGAPVVAKVRGRRVPGWGLERNAAAPPPPCPVSSSEPERDLVLIPYGSTNLRVTEFPVLG
jgi:hypothetical protein